MVVIVRDRDDPVGMRIEATLGKELRDLHIGGRRRRWDGSGGPGADSRPASPKQVLQDRSKRQRSKWLRLFFDEPPGTIDNPPQRFVGLGNRDV
jgi:hypothetical protein